MSYEESQVYYLTKLLDMHDWNCTKAAKSVGLIVNTLHSKLRKYNIKRKIL